MFKLSDKDYSGAIPMSEMEPCQIGIVATQGDFYNETVMRTANEDDFEVMNLTNPGRGCHWGSTDNTTLKVLILPKGSKITLEVV